MVGDKSPMVVGEKKRRGNELVVAVSRVQKNR